MNEWIRVKDRLPTEKDKYIICLINDFPILCEVHNSTFSLNENRLSFYWPTKEWIKDKFYGEITHWTPLPIAPKD